MKKSIFTFLSLFSILLWISCGPGDKSNKGLEGKEQIDEAAADLENTKYTVYKAPPSFDYAKSSLKMVAPKESLLDTGKTTFKFKVSNYELGVQTPDAEGRGIANSGNGQHIHFILNNDPYSAHYESEFIKDLPEGNHVVLAFLSRSYHEAVKNSNSFVLKELIVGTPEDKSFFVASDPHLFYSRPKGTYSGKDTEKLMIDFFLFNTSISPDGNKVRATINGEVHYIKEWAPHYVEGLGKGEVTIKLELVDKDDKLIPGPFNSVERKVMLE